MIVSKEFVFKVKTLKRMDELIKHQVISQDDEIEKYKKDQIILEGWLEKQSRYLGSWRKRWVVIYRDDKDKIQMCTFKEKEKYQSPTEIITLDGNVELKKDSKKVNEFNVYSKSIQNLFCFKCAEEFELTQWLETIKSIIPQKPKDKQYYGSYDDENNNYNKQQQNNNNNNNDDDNKEDLL